MFETIPTNPQSIMVAASDFEGFPPSGLQFLADLKENNNREWFNERKELYLNDLVEPAKAFVAGLGGMLQGLNPSIHFDTRTNGSGSMFRIYRDVRFSKDKSPYKTHVGMVFWIGSGKKTDCPGFYVGVGADGAGVYGGMWQFAKQPLAAYRKAVDDPTTGDRLAAILETLRADGYEIGGDTYKRVPHGFDPEHPHADLLKQRGLHAGQPAIEADVVSSPLFIPAAFEHCARYLPLVEWLSDNT
jgi:uncharacterized protein (TIGR02453 family)